MDQEEIRKNLRRLTEDAEARLTRALLLWKCKKEGAPTPQRRQLERESRRIAEKAHEIVSRRGRKIWKELKDACSRNENEEKGPRG